MAKAHRILFVAPPGYGHVFPMVPLAWAFQAAGHDVRVATCGVSVNAAVRAGLAVFDVAPEANIATIQQRHDETFKAGFPPRDGDLRSIDGPSIFDELCGVMVDGVIAVTREWGPGLIVYTPEAAAAVIAASTCSLPSVLLGVGFAHTPRLVAQRQEALRATFARYGIRDATPPCAWIDLTPPSLRDAPLDGWPMRYLQYNGGHATRTVEQHARRQVAVTLGTIAPQVCGLTPLKAVIEAAAHVDASFIVAHGTSHARDLGTLPANVQASHWIGLDVLVRSCQAGIHHGGFGTSLAMLAAGLPQLVLPLGADQFYNASALARRGVALVPPAETIEPATLQQLLDARPLRMAAETVAAEIAAMPPPASLVDPLLALALAPIR